MLGPVASCLAPGGEIVALVKPQFEAGKKDAPGGVVRDPAVHRAVLERAVEAARAAGLTPLAICRSPLTGPAGNVEFFLHARTGAGALGHGTWRPRPTRRNHRGDRVNPSRRGPSLDHDDAAIVADRTPVRRIGFAYNPTKEDAIELSARATGFCAVRGIDAWTLNSGDFDALREALPGTDAVVVLGGDGTFLRAARVLTEVDVPIVGVNLGKVGFLSKAEAEGLEAMLAKIVEGRYRIEPRMALRGEIHAAGATTASASFKALNDVVVARGSLARVVRFSVDIGESHLATYIADGLIVASPTGSTGYSFSAGGPILDPESRNLIVTPIAAYLSAIRSIVVSPDQHVAIRIEEAYEALVSIDGYEDHALTVGDVVTVSAVDRPIRFLQPEGSPPFWDLLRQKAQLLPS